MDALSGKHVEAPLPGDASGPELPSIGCDLPEVHLGGNLAERTFKVPTNPEVFLEVKKEVTETERLPVISLNSVLPVTSTEQ